MDLKEEWQNASSWLRVSCLCAGKVWGWENRARKVCGYVCVCVQWSLFAHIIRGCSDIGALAVLAAEWSISVDYDNRPKLASFVAVVPAVLCYFGGIERCRCGLGRLSSGNRFLLQCHGFCHIALASFCVMGLCCRFSCGAANVLAGFGPFWKVF